MAYLLLVLVVLFFAFIGLIVFFRSDCDFTLLYYALKRKDLHVLQGKVIWITGASSGIGETLAYLLARCGAKLILSARREDLLSKVLEKCKELSPVDNRDAHMLLVLDLLQHDCHEKLAKQVVQEYGKIDYLINNAGRSQRSADSRTKLEVIDLLLKTNTLGSISLTKAVLPHMVNQKSGCLVYTSSVAGKMGSPGSAGYSASKHALQGYIDTLRMEISRQGVDVVSVCPGPVHSGFLRQVLGTDLNEDSGVVDQSSVGDRVTTDRCAYLIAIAMANRLDEVWIAKQPILFFTYVTQYAPVLAKRIGKRIGIRRLEAIESGKKDIDSGIFLKSRNF